MTNQVKLNDRKLMIALPVYDGRINVMAAFEIINLCSLAARFGFEIELAHISFCSILPKARNVLAHRFLKSDCTDLLFLDSDVTFTHDDIVRLMAVATNKDIVAGIYPRKKADKNLIANVIYDEKGDLIFDENGLFEAACVPTGFMLIRRHVLEKLRDLHPEWAYSDEEGEENGNRAIHYAFFDFSLQNGLYYGEDYTFCMRARDAGMKVHIDPGLVIGHYGNIELKNSVVESFLNPYFEKKALENKE